MASQIISFVLCLACGLCLIWIAVVQIRSGNPSMLHSYHRVNVPPENLPKLARESGRGLVVSGGGVVVLSAGLLGLPGPVTVAVTVVGTGAMLAGVGIACLAIIRYNGSLFG